MNVTRKRYLALFGAAVASAVLYVVKPEEKQALNMSIKITARGKL